jgi:diguanylate cyclase
MACDISERKRTMAVAERAFAFIAENGLTADPRTYEVAYTHSSGVNRALDSEIAAAVARDGALTQDMIDGIYRRLFAPAAHLDGIDNAGEKVAAEMAKIIGLLTGMMGAAEADAAVLDRTRKAFGSSAGPDDVRTALETLTSTAQRMQQSNAELRDNLDRSKEEIGRLQTDLQIVRENSVKDPLTQVYNRKFFDDTLAKSMKEADGPLALVMIDIDHFKKFNDTYGHPVGDQVLRVVANLLQSNIKGKDTVARYGGEEFALILPDTSLRQAAFVADSIRRAVMDKELKKKSTGEKLGRITLSMGIAVMTGEDTQETLLARADQGLYAAKRHGRNRVICETDVEFAQEKVAAAA